MTRRTKLSAAAVDLLSTLADGGVLLWSKRTGSFFTIAGDRLKARTVAILQERDLIARGEERNWVIEFVITDAGREALEKALAAAYMAAYRARKVSA